MRRVVIVGYPQVELLDVACVSDTFDTANRHGANPPYSIEFATLGAQPATSGSGLVLAGQHALERITGPLDTIVVSGGYGHEQAAADPVLVAHVRRLARESRRVASVCSGTSVLAAAGLLDGRRCTTHWFVARSLQERYPRIEVDPKPLYIKDDNVYTSAGVTSALDLSLALVEEDHGAALARAVARGLVTYLQRPGNQAQVSMYVQAPAPENSVVRKLVTHIAANLDEDLGTTALADRAGVSERHLTRLFLDHIGRPPAKYVRETRTEAAARLLTGTPLPLAAIARRCGFGSAETLRQAFVGQYGIPPSRYRNLT
ncbi:GlxA family transcriptional regulator [Kutzneria chonburiensis]|uniref:GlxA family transcriptional regulator n=1 Tax=Kutzneria chonburiensis TaxID=1483604 RepID=A0ABV6N184_9PSEU|nr:GlxA family transcriptional regulator [Kutzneria chonburiensis]